MADRDRSAKRDLRHLVREVINGRPLSDVPVCRYPDLRAGLDKAKSRAVSFGRIARLKFIQQLLAELTRLERKARRASAPPPSKVSLPSSAELDRDIAQILESQDRTSDVRTEMIPFVTRRLRTYTIPALVSDSSFSEAQDAHDLLGDLNSEFRIRQKSAAKTQRDAQTLKALEEAEFLLESAEDLYQQELNGLELAIAEAVEKVHSQNEKELELFDAETQGRMPAFSKTFSSELQLLKDTQRRMINAKRYRDAGLVFDRITEMTEAELEVLEDRYLRTRESKRQALLAQHMQRVGCTVAKFEAHRLAIVARNEREIAGLRQTVANLERRLGHAAGHQKPPKSDRQSSEWGASPVVRRTASQRRLARRLPWSLSHRVLPVTGPVSDIQEPHWKAACRSPVTASTEIMGRSFGQSRILGKTEIRGSSVPGSAGAAQPREEAEDGITYTQMIDARRTAAAQAKKRIGFADMIGERSEVDEFVDSLPPSRRNSRRHES
jgi:hypothetical protein